MPAPSSIATSSRIDNIPEGRFTHLWLYFSRYKAWFFAGALFLLLTNVMALAIPGYLGHAVHLMREAAGKDVSYFVGIRSELVAAAMMIVVFAIGAGIARVYSRVMIFNAGRYIEYDVRNELYAKLTALDGRYYSEHPTGDITSRVANDVTYVRLLYAIAFLHIVNATVAYGIAIHKMVALDLVLTLACLAPYPILLFMIRRVMHSLFEHTKLAQAQLATLSTKVQENLTGIEVVKSYVLEESEKQSFGGLNRSYFKNCMRVVRTRGTLDALMTLIAGSGTLIVLWIGSQKVLSGEMSVSEFVEFNGYVVALAFPTIAMGWVFSVWHRGLAAFDRVREILLAEQPETESTAGESKSLPPMKDDTKYGGITFENVSFQYQDEVILQGITLEIPAGATVAIVGKTGAGKSSLVKLIARQFEPTEGRICVDGVAIQDVALRQLRRELAFVPQDAFLFSMTIRQNIRFGLDALEFDSTIERPVSFTAGDIERRIENVVEVAGLAQEIESFPDGLDTLVGERGVTLSGGQKQRVTIARALLVEPRILVLDDALSSVDTQTEATIMDHLLKTMNGRTCIMLTHRFNALHRCDKIFVLNDGRLVEQGTHEELLKQGGVYAGMVERQQLQETLEGQGS